MIETARFSFRCHHLKAHSLLGPRFLGSVLYLSPPHRHFFIFAAIDAWAKYFSRERPLAAYVFNKWLRRHHVAATSLKWPRDDNIFAAADRPLIFGLASFMPPGHRIITAVILAFGRSTKS